MNRKTKKLLPLAVAAALTGAVAGAHAEGFSYGGYFRAGPSYGADKGHPRTCYQAIGSEWKYRLGNECDYYGEFMLAYGVGKANETQYNIYFMPNFYQGGVSDGSQYGANAANLHSEQLYGEVVHPDFAPNTTWWAGTRFYGRQNGNMIDTFFVNMSGTGGGGEIDFGGGTKLGLAFFRTDGSALAGVPGGASSSGSPGSRFNADLYLPMGFRLTLAATKGDFSSATPNADGQSGTAVSLQHHSQPMGASSDNFVWLQFSSGSAYLNSNFGTLTDGSDVKHQRLADNFTYQVTPTFGVDAIAAYQEDKCSTSNSCIGASAYKNGTQKHTSLGGRIAWGFPGIKNFKIDAEAAVDSVKYSDAAVGTARMTKFTIAPTITGGPGINDRPEIRFYVTTAKWNDGNNVAANEAASGATTGTGYGDLGGKTSGTSVGIQLETWF